MSILKADTRDEWIEAVLGSFDEFLIDHAANERKASAAALSLVAHYPDKPNLISAMIDLALEELGHYRQVMKLMLERGIKPLADEKDPYVNQLLKNVRKESNDFFLDRLLCPAIIEARGAERFGLIAHHHQDDQMRRFYQALEKSEASHYQLFLSQAGQYFDQATIDTRWQQWLDIEAQIMLALPLRARLH